MTRALLSSLALLLAAPAAASAATTTADASSGATCERGGTCQTIGAAVGVSQPGDSVRVLGGTYAESISVEVANLTIHGEGTVLVAHAGSGPAITASAGSLKLEDLNVAATETALEVTAGTGNRVQRSTLAGTDAAVVSASGAGDRDLTVDSSVLIGGGEGAAARATTADNSGNVALTLNHVTALNGVVLDGGGSGVLTPGNITAAVNSSIVRGTSSAEGFAGALGLPFPAANTVTATYTRSDSEDMTTTGGATATGDGTKTPDEQVFAERLRLKRDSPLIGKGDVLAEGESTKDIDGDPRIVGDASDIGADEYLNHPPKLTLEVTPTQAGGGEIVHAIGTAVDPEGASDIAGYAVDWGDGTKSNGTDRSLPHVYDKAGTFEVKMVAVDQSGAFSNVETKTVTISDDDPPQVVVTSPKAGSTLSLTGGGPKRLAIKGVDADASGIDKIEIALTRRTGGCAHYNGKKFARGACKSPVFLPAITKTFRFRLATRVMSFKPGNYQVRVRATDTVGNTNKSFTKKAGTLVAFTVA